MGFVSSFPALAKVPAVRLALLCVSYHRAFGRFPNLAFPKRFTEKIQVAKLTWRSSLMPVLADKVLAKDYVASHFDPDLVTPTLFAGPALPPLAERNWPRPYVIKANNRSGGNVFVFEAADENWPRIDAQIARWLGTPYSGGYQWAYDDIQPQVLVEPFIGTGRDAPPDFKFYVFGGRLEFIDVHRDRFGEHRATIYDRDWKVLPFGIKDRIDPSPVDKPPALDQMVAYAEAMGQDFPFVRIDLYQIDGKPRFGEYTFYPDSGFAKIAPDEYDLWVGSLWPAGVPK